MRLSGTFTSATVSLARLTAVWQAFADSLQDPETLVGHRPPVEVQAMPVETPGQAGLRGEGGRGGDRLEGDACTTECRVSAPEPLWSTKIRQSGVDSDARSSGDQQAVGLTDHFGAAPIVFSHLQTPCPRWS